MSALRRFRILDEAGNLSLTNLTMFVALGTFVFVTVRTSAVDMTALGALLTALTSYRAKSWQQDRKEAREAEKLKAELAEVKRELARAPRAGAAAAPLPAGLKR